MFTATQKKEITKLFDNISKDDEFEIMFNNYKSDNVLSLIDFMNVLKYIKYTSENKHLELIETISLDIFYEDYRISVNNLDNINNLLGLVYQRKNNNIINIIVSQYLDKDGFELIQKIKDRSNIIDINDYDIRFRKSKEIKVTDEDKIKSLTKISLEDSNKVYFRFKQRITLKLTDEILIDMTIVKSNNDVNNLMSSISSYEIEIEYIQNNKPKSDTLTKILDQVEQIKKVMTNSDILITKDVEDEVIRKYKSLTYGNTFEGANILYSMQPISAEVQHIIDYIPNKYSVTDKADGDKAHLFIHKGDTYLISNNLHVTKTKMNIKDLDNTIIEGELIHLVDKKSYVFMMFDCLYFKNEDIRSKTLLTTRLKYLEKICNSIDIKPYINKEYDGKYNLDKIKEHYIKNINDFYSELNKEITKLKQNDILLYPKLFLFPSGGNSSEVFLFSDIVWNNCTKSTNVNCPYLLDGIILTPVEQKYTRERKEQKHAIYKYKPPHTNSLDVYITFEKNKETGGYMDIFDNSIPNKLENKTFRIINLFVGEIVGGREQPAPFMKDMNNHIIYMPLINGHVRDVEGNIVQDKTVIEVTYTNDTTMPHPYRWQILKTRWDKTESVIRNNIRYGNNKDIAERVWKSMIESVTIDEISNLANPKNYDMQMKLLSSRLDSSIINSQKKQDIYYQKITNLLKKMREFNNWIKSIIIYTYCSPMPISPNGKIVRQNILDIGCGRGGDILKMYHARIGEYVGIDVDFEGIYSATDGAISRYNFLKSKFPDFGKVTFIQADGGVILDSEHQNKAISNLSKENIAALNKVFTKDRKFDIFNSQFAIHYLFANQTTIDNFIHNIKTYLKKDGYILLTLFDPEQIISLFDDSGRITSFYTDDDGKRNILYEIVRKYKGDLSNTYGQSIDVHMSWISEEGKYIEEYLVTKELLVETMKKADCQLLDTDLFSNIYNMNKPYFKDVIQYEENPKNKQFYEKVAEFYGDLKGADKESRNWAFLFRYYVFKKN